MEIDNKSRRKVITFNCETSWMNVQSASSSIKNREQKRFILQSVKNWIKKITEYKQFWSFNL